MSVQFIGKTQQSTDKIPSSTVNLLPGDLGGAILDLEIECETEDTSKEMMVRLIELYSKAIEYYQACGSPKVKIFQHRLHVFMRKPLTQAILTDKSVFLSLRKENIKRDQAEAHCSLKEQAKNLIENSERRAESNGKNLKSSIVLQEENLKVRISRRKAMSNRSINSQLNFEDLDIQNESILQKKLFLGNKNSKKVLI